MHALNLELPEGFGTFGLDLGGKQFSHACLEER